MFCRLELGLKLFIAGMRSLPSDISKLLDDYLNYEYELTLTPSISDTSLESFCSSFSYKSLFTFAYFIR